MPLIGRDAGRILREYIHEYMYCNIRFVVSDFTSTDAFNQKRKQDKKRPYLTTQTPEPIPTANERPVDAQATAEPAQKKKSR